MIAPVPVIIYRVPTGQEESQEKVKIFKSQEKVSKFWYRSEHFEIHLEVMKMSGKMGVDINMNPSFQILTVRWCHDLFPSPADAS